MRVCGIDPPAQKFATGFEAPQTISKDSSQLSIKFNAYTTSHSDCPSVTATHTTVSGFDAISDATKATVSADGLTVDFANFSAWTAPSYPFTSNFKMEVKFAGTSDVVYTESYSITIFDCGSLTPITAPSAFLPSIKVENFGQTFDETINWGDFKYTGNESLCPITHNQVVIDYADGAKSTFIVQPASN